MPPPAALPDRPAGEGEPALTRVGGGRSARISLLAVLGVLGALLSVVTLGQPTKPAVPLPTVSPAAIAHASNEPLDATPAITVGATPSAPSQPSGAHFEAAMQREGAAIEPVVLLDLAGQEHSAELDLPAQLWDDMPRLAVSWSDGRPAGRRVQLALVELSLGDTSRIGLPAPLADGRVMLPVPMAGNRSWTYRVLLDRAHRFSDPDELIVVVSMSPAVHSHAEARFFAGDDQLATIVLDQTAGGYSGSLSVTGRASRRPSAMRLVWVAAQEGAHVLVHAPLDWGHPRGPTLPLELAAGRLRLVEPIDAVTRWEYLVQLVDSRLNGFELDIELRPAFPEKAPAPAPTR